MFYYEKSLFFQRMTFFHSFASFIIGFFLSLQARSTNSTYENQKNNNIVNSSIYSFVTIPF